MKGTKKVLWGVKRLCKDGDNEPMNFRKGKL